jgi:excisionase family DNA binding protein
MLGSSGFDTWSSTAKRGSVKRNVGKRWHSGFMSSTQGGDPAPRFLTLADVAEILATSVAQVRALVQSGELRYIQIGGRQQYRIETVELEKYIQRMYAESDAKKDRQPSSRD